MSINFKSKTRIIFSFCAMCFLHSGLALAATVSDFEDGTLQGWTKGTPFFNTLFGGDLALSTIGNPGSSMIATDSVSGGGGLYAQAPVTFTGDLSIYSDISWDEYLPSSSLNRTSISLLGANNTVYRGITSDQNMVIVNNWENRLIPFDFASGLWELRAGSDSFEDVLSNVTGLYIQMDVTQTSLSEARVDNITLAAVPVPAAIWLFGSGLLGLIGYTYRGCKTAG